MKVIRLWLGLLLMGNFVSQGFGQPGNDEVIIEADIRFLIQQKKKKVFHSGLETNVPQNRESVDTRKVFYVLSGDEYVGFRVAPNILTEKIRYRGNPELNVYRRIETGEPEEPYRYATVFNATISPDNDDYILVGDAGSSKGNAISLSAIPLNHDLIPDGTILVYNIGSRNLYIQSDSGRIRVPVHQFSPIDVSSSQPYRFRVMAAAEVDGKPELVYNRLWPIMPDIRAICLFYDIPGEPSNWTHLLIRL